MPIDFTIALARLLRDGALRDRFAADPEVILQAMDVEEGDWASLRQLSVQDLEYQAEILLRKRLDKVRAFLPSTCARLKDAAVPIFLQYARTSWPEEGSLGWKDAEGFLAFLQSHSPESISRSDAYRVAFLKGDRSRELHWSNDLWIRGRSRRGLQILRRTELGNLRESAVYLGL